MKKLAIILALSIATVGCSRNVEKVRENAPAVLKSNGFTVVGEHGYQLSAITGVFVWYTLEKGENTYQGAVCKWFDEYHIYNLEALDAVSGKVSK